MRTIAAKDKGRFFAAPDPLTCHACGGGAVLGETAKRVGDRLRPVAHSDQTIRRPLAAMRRAVDEAIGDICRRALQRVVPAHDHVGEAFLRRRADRQRARLGRRFRGRRLGGVRLTQNDMSVRAAKTKRVDAGEPGLVARLKLNRVCRDLKVQVVEGDIRVQLIDMKAFGILPGLQRHLRLQHPDKAGGGLQMAKVGLGGADNQRLFAAAAKDLADRVRLHRVADRGARAVAFEERQIIRIELKLFQHLAQQVGLTFRRRHRHTGGASVGIDAGANNNRPNRVAVLLGVIHPAQHKGHRALGPDIPVRRTVERLAEPFRRQHRGAGKTDKGEGRQQGVHAANDGGVDLTRPQRLYRLMHGVERGRTGGVDRVARPFEIKQVGNAVRDDGKRVSRHELRVHISRVGEEGERMVRSRGADIDAGTPFREFVSAQPGVLNRLPDRLKQNALLGVHLKRLARRDVEETGVEIPDVLNLTGGEGVGTAKDVLVAVQPAGVRPPIRQRFRYDTAAFVEDIPECVRIRSLRQSASIPGYRNVIRVFG